MALDMHQLIYDAKMLAERLKDKENDADFLMSQTQTLKKRLDAMKQYQEDLTELNEVAHHRPRATLIHEIAKENRLIRELQQENYDLRTSLEEHQTALEMIMTKYRQQIAQLVSNNRTTNNSEQTDQSQEITKLIDKICEMAYIMQEAVHIDETSEAMDMSSMVEKLRQENHGLRELLAISTVDLHKIIESQNDKSIQTLNDSITSESSDDWTPNHLSATNVAVKANNVSSLGLSIQKDVIPVAQSVLEGTATVTNTLNQEIPNESGGE